jgi:hypothetical protein
MFKQGRVNPKVRNPMFFGLSVDGKRDPAGTPEALLQDAGIDIIMANDSILVQALEKPKEYIANRSDFFKAVAKIAAATSQSILSEMDNFVKLPPSISLDIARSVGGQILTGTLNAIDKQVSGVNDMVVNKLATTTN